MTILAVSKKSIEIMGRASSRKSFRRDESERLAPNEGTLEVSFVFGGRKFVRQHQCTASELKHMKDLCKEYGDEAASQLIWKVNVKGAMSFAQSVVAESAMAYIKKHRKPKPSAVGTSVEPIALIPATPELLLKPATVDFIQNVVDETTGPKFGAEQ